MPGATYVYARASVTDCPSGFATVTSTIPTLCGGAIMMMLVALPVPAMVAGASPNRTVAPDAKFAPVIVICMPPELLPLVGDRLCIVGAAARVSVLVGVAVAGFDVAVAVGTRVAVAVGTAVGIAVGTGVAVAVGVGVLVAVAVGDAVAVGAGGDDLNHALTVLYAGLFCTS